MCHVYIPPNRIYRFSCSLFHFDTLSSISFSLENNQTFLTIPEIKPASSSGSRSPAKKSHIVNGKASPSGSNGRRVKFPAKRVAADEDDELEKCFMKVTGMTCSSCVANIERNLMKMEGMVQ